MAILTEPSLDELNKFYYFDLERHMVRAKNGTHGARKAPENPTLWQPVSGDVPLNQRTARLEDALRLAKRVVLASKS